MLYRVAGDRVVDVKPSKSLDEDLYERHTEEWVEKRPEILGEPLLIIGRQVQMDEGRDRIDLLAMDQAARLVVVELKRDRLGGSVDIQGLRYAALVAGWTHDQISRQAEGYWSTTGQSRGTFTQELEEFCEEGYELNGDQRLILVGQDIKPRLGTMALWLRDHAIDVRVVSLSLFKDEAANALYIQPQVVIPPPSEERLRAKIHVGSSDQPWLRDGQAWHLEQRCSPKGREILERLVELIGEALPDAEGPNWNQKHYVSWKATTRQIIRVNTLPNQAALHVANLPVEPEVAAKRLGWEQFQGDADLSDKFALGSSVGAHRGPWTRFIVKEAADLADPARTELIALLRETWAVNGAIETSASSDAESVIPS